ncbi:MAG: hypothetical protein UX49_C0001G0005 [Candidatus Wolfebacteria bacterium GW2011_GWC2_46_275]|uniref:Leucine-binding protein domain-containing protein n=2 Tax=Candidatus Wolfeibacteriota TaxID=1752735 RepID=A0A0G1WJ24_9BACT|nr:MAG: hypothetical protein UX70_C0001G0505 [Candidatus Wolfebacteria bacterium GW2011_GWB1_47_1]KKU37135.1 MAG: hypothetical protein UX49_C0001G0005 [Candidatus Wolfebacteria bacterium GW2011_GWC2_46_275]KKU42705.1 MAG: hypothetical protein UX58_C0001G0137 [Candidatus Wolfebacteria bacterium GW2011_GWB2_46_69]KKU54560.1 MAG: hypothetical protein UX76_C0001G0019 [Candidatus Wolfebacteria bacterium GW2011_GWC1_47_103]KKU59944.1 MAG: hypothetical protein UX83_C0001G0019 [Candidatus Wolfebacteria
MNRSKKWALGIVSIIAIVATGYLITKGPDGIESPRPIKIGFIGPLTGENAAIGEGIKNAIALSAKDKNIQVIYEDDRFDGKLGVAAYHKLRTVDKVDAIINTTPAVIDAITPLVKNDPIVIIQIAEPELSANDTIFQIMPSGAMLYKKLGGIAKDSYTSFAFVYQEGAAFEKAKDAFKKEYTDSDHLFREYRVGTSKDYRAIITKINNEGVAAYTVIGTPSVGSQFIKQAMEQRIQSRLLCNADMEVTIGEYLKVLPSSAFNDCLSVMFADRMSTSFKSDYKNQFGTDPGFATDYGFDAVAILIGTYYKDILKWADALNHLNFDGASGKVQFNDFGVRIPEIETHIFKDGKFTNIR